VSKIDNLPCRKCWYCEGGRCFNGKLGHIPKKSRGFGYKGRKINERLARRCIKNGRARFGVKEAILKFFTDWAEHTNNSFTVVTTGKEASRDEQESIG